MADITWSFAGRVALVSGGASGIGRAAAAAWIAAGARVAVFDQSAERLEETAGALGRGALVTVAGDVSDPDDRERAVAGTLGRIGRAEDIAQAILFLSSEAAEWVTGQCFYVDGGQSLVALPPYIDLVERLLGGKL